MCLRFSFVISINVDLFNQIRYFSIKYLPNYPPRDWVDPVPYLIHFKTLEVPEIELVASWLVVKYIDQLGHFQCSKYVIEYILWQNKIY